MKTHLKAKDRTFIELPQTENMYFIKISASTPIFIRCMDSFTKSALLNGGTVEVPIPFAAFGSMDNVTIVDLKHTIMGPFKDLSINLKPNYPLSIMFENQDYDVEFSVEVEEVIYVPARVDRIKLRLSGDLPF